MSAVLHPPPINRELDDSKVFLWENSIHPQDCDQLIQLFEDLPDFQYKGSHGAGEHERLAEDGRMNMYISDNPIFEKFDDMLFQALAGSMSEMMQIYGIAEIDAYDDTGYMIQRYEKGQQYGWHVDNNHPETMNRFLAAIWYLNDNFEGGTTEFMYQGLNITPRQGSLVLFPPFWTHLHRSTPILEGAKHIITTWLVLKDG